ncbi:unnamed protein product [Didymodactylos carnosus]|uniref:FAD-binding domain-containing protein n=1 Tax=Didymodactylos carnosus TaxID=1234261 RepID=A0A815EUG5_9BILA|nr:unnamed protein product [Didymodactylos carnosus]CAF4148315.1 unnamed protein product [Didymodactylos carnosus]
MIIIDLLIKHNISTGIKNKQNQNVLHKAIEYNSLVNVKHLLVKCHMDVNNADEEGMTYLMYACEHSTPQIVEILLKFGANTVIKDNRNMTAIDYASKNHDTYSESILELLEYYKQNQNINTRQQIEKDDNNNNNNNNNKNIYQTQVSIIGGGPAGLVLSQLLFLAGIESIVVEKRSKESIETRIRAGALEQVTVDLFDHIGVGEQIHRQGLISNNMNFLFNGKHYSIPVSKLTNGKVNTVYPQQSIVKNLIEDRLKRNGEIWFEIENIEIFDYDKKHSVLRYKRNKIDEELHCDFVIGCDGFHGISRKTIPHGILKTYEKFYPFSWLSIIVVTKPAKSKLSNLVYAYHDRGLVIYVMRSEEVARYHLQVDATDNVNDWPDERIWNELKIRLKTNDNSWKINEGKVIEKRIFPLRSFMIEPMQYKNIYLAGDVAHLVPPTIAKGLNMAVADVKILSKALIYYYETNSLDKLKQYSTICLNRLWRVEDFSNYVTELWHHDFTKDDFYHKTQRARVESLCEFKILQQEFCEMLVGLLSSKDTSVYNNVE